jgi:phosphate transport system protein
MMAQTEIRVTFQRNLNALQDDLVRLGSMVDTAIQRAVHALKFQDGAMARDIIASDREINDLRFEIEENCLKLIAQQQPMAGDLRRIFTVMHIVLDLERMGDHAAGIAKIVVQMAGEPPLKPLVDLPRMADICREMLRQSLDAFVARDTDSVHDIIKRDDDVDELYNQIFREIITYLAEDPKAITRGMYLLFASHNLERIADRVTNICERILFLTTGELAEIPPGETNLKLSGSN